MVSPVSLKKRQMGYFENTSKSETFFIHDAGRKRIGVKVNNSIYVGDIGKIRIFMEEFSDGEDENDYQVISMLFSKDQVQLIIDELTKLL